MELSSNDRREYKTLAASQAIIKPIADRQFEIEFLGSGVEAFAFTFG